MNSPTITSTKWWPGDMGLFATHALIFAQLIIEDDGDKNMYGVAPFIV
jgi:acyl-CoA oxidase